MHDRKTEMTKFISSKSQKSKSYQNNNANDNTLIGLMSNKSHNAIKHEMIYLLELFRFGLTPYFKETHLSIVFNSFSAIHAIVRALHSIGAALLTEVAQWFVASNMLSMIAETVLSLKCMLGEYEHQIKQKEENNVHADKKRKILSHIGYEIWNILSTLSMNNQKITFISLFDTHLIGLYDDNHDEEQQQKYFE